MLPTPRARVRTRNIRSTAQLARASAASLRLEIGYVAPGDLKPSDVKLRRRQRRQLEHLMASVRKFGCVLPILVNQNGEVIAGEAVLEAAKQIGLLTVPIVRIEHLSDVEVRALRIALNQLGTLSSWDETVLGTELKFLSSVSFELPTFTGFDSVELDVLTSKPVEKANGVDEVPVPCPEHVVSRPGDIWNFKGDHKVACLDARDSTSYRMLLGTELAGLICSDPPYNVQIKGHVTRRLGAREFAMASGEMSSEAFVEFLTTTLRLSAAHSRDGSLSLQFMDWRHIKEMMAAGEAVYGPLFNLAVWSKTNPGMGSPWRSGHELCFIWKNGSAPHVDNIQLGRAGRYRSNVWLYPGANQCRDPWSEGHATPKNLAMIQDAILDVSNRGDIVLDAFAGSGTTLVAAHLARRRGYGLEIDPPYVDLTVRRMEARTRAPARHAETGLTFEETATVRGVLLPSASPAR